MEISTCYNCDLTNGCQTLIVRSLNAAICFQKKSAEKSDQQVEAGSDVANFDLNFDDDDLAFEPRPPLRTDKVYIN